MTYKMHTTSQMETRNGIAWTADLNFDGKKIGDIENSGNGGCDTVFIADNTERANWNKFVANRFDNNEETATYQLFINEMNNLHYAV